MSIKARDLILIVLCAGVGACATRKEVRKLAATMEMCEVFMNDQRQANSVFMTQGNAIGQRVIAAENVLKQHDERITAAVDSISILKAKPVAIKKKNPAR